MTDKCWFVLRHQHYPPPRLPANGVGFAEGPICPGHLIPDLKKLDNVINRKGLEDFPPDMPIYKRTTQGFRRSAEADGELTVSAGANVPVAAAIGVDINLNIEKTFQRSVSNAWKFAALDSFIVQVTPSYVEDSMDAPEVVEYMKKHEVLGISRSIFMVTGLMVARGGSSSSLEQGTTGGGAEVGSEIPGVAGVHGAFAISSGQDVSTLVEKADDFVWAIRLAKITRGLIDRSWSYRTLSTGATFDLNVAPKSKADIEHILAMEGLSGHEVITDNRGEEFFIL